MKKFNVLLPKLRAAVSFLMVRNNILGDFRYGNSLLSPSDYLTTDDPAICERKGAISSDQFLYDRCCRYMIERRPFLVEKFSLQDLATAVFTNKVYLSKTINRYSGRNFRQYVNYYRIMYAMDLFRSNMGLRIAELSRLSGFHSTTVFLRSFKSVTGTPPSHWCAQTRKSYRKLF